ncbi:hypothetical protein D3C72_1922120 [compost metagenome]
MGIRSGGDGDRFCLADIERSQRYASKCNGQRGGNCHPDRHLRNAQLYRGAAKSEIDATWPALSALGTAIPKWCLYGLSEQHHECALLSAGYPRTATSR